MFGIAVVTDDSAGGMQLGGGQDFVTVDDRIVVVRGDPVQGHGVLVHASPVMAEGSSFVTINGIPVCRAGHLASCGHPSTGRGWLTLED